MAMALEPVLTPPRNEKGWRIEDLYTIVGQIAKGGYGAVMLAQQKDPPEKHVAIKRTRKSPDSNGELSILNTLSEKCYPFILSLRDVYEDPINYYFVTDYYCGGTLRQVIRRACGFREDVMKFYAAQLVTAVEFIHKNHIIHLDIKSANILMDRTGNLVLADFGMAVRRAIPTVRWSKVPTNGAVGTPGYQSPEMLQEHAGHEASDWWAVGIVCCEMLNTRRPFSSLNNDTTELKRSILQDEPTLPEAMSRECNDFLKQLLQKNMGMRLGSCNVSDVKTHQFFQDINWQEVSQKSIMPPLKSTMIYETYKFYNTHTSTSSVTEPVMLQPIINVQFRKRKKVKKPDINTETPEPTAAAAAAFPFPVEDFDEPPWLQQQQELDDEQQQQKLVEDEQQQFVDEQPQDQLGDEQEANRRNPFETTSSINLFGMYNNPEIPGTGSNLSCRPKFNAVRQRENIVSPIQQQSSRGTNNYRGTETGFEFEPPFDAPMQENVAEQGTPYHYDFPGTLQLENISSFLLKESKIPESDLPSSFTTIVPSNAVLPKKTPLRESSRQTTVTRLDNREIGLSVLPDVHGQKSVTTRHREPKDKKCGKNVAPAKAASSCKSKISKYFKSFRKSAEASRSAKHNKRLVNGEDQSHGIDSGYQGNAVENEELNVLYEYPLHNNNTIEPVGGLRKEDLGESSTNAQYLNAFLYNDMGPVDGVQRMGDLGDSSFGAQYVNTSKFTAIGSVERQEREDDLDESSINAQYANSFPYNAIEPVDRQVREDSHDGSFNNGQYTIPFVDNTLTPGNRQQKEEDFVESSTNDLYARPFSTNTLKPVDIQHRKSDFPESPTNDQYVGTFAMNTAEPIDIPLRKSDFPESPTNDQYVSTFAMNTAEPIDIPLRKSDFPETPTINQYIGSFGMNNVEPINTQQRKSDFPEFSTNNHFVSSFGMNTPEPTDLLQRQSDLVFSSTNEQYTSPFDINTADPLIPQARLRKKNHFSEAFDTEDKSAESSHSSYGNQPWNALSQVHNVDYQNKDSNEESQNYLLTSNTFGATNEDTEANGEYNLYYQRQQQQTYEVEELCNLTEMHM